MKPSEKRTTLQDVADAAGCSLSTVSTVLNQSKGNSKVTEATRLRIEETAKRLGYRPNLNARRLASQRCDDIIGVLIDSCAPFLYRDILAEFEKAVSACGMHLMIGMLHNDLDRIKKYINVFLGSGIRQVFCMTHNYPEFGTLVPPLFDEFDQVVFFGQPLTPTRFPYIATDDFTNYKNAVKYLLACGKKNICHLRSNRQDSSYQPARSGFLAAYEEAGLSYPGEPFVDCAPDFFTSEAEAEAAIVPLLERKPDALMLHDDESAFWAMRILERRHIRVPEDMAIFSGNLWRFARCGSPALAGIGFQPQKISTAALRIFQHQEPAAILIPAQIIPGDSCCRRNYTR